MFAKDMYLDMVDDIYTMVTSLVEYGNNPKLTEELCRNGLDTIEKLVTQYKCTDRESVKLDSKHHKLRHILDKVSRM